MSKDLLFSAKYYGFADHTIAQLTGSKEEEIRSQRRKEKITPVYKMVDTCAGEFDAKTPYYYSTYDHENECLPSQNKKTVVLGAGPIRTGQIEFDYCSVHASCLREEGVESIIINNNLKQLARILTLPTDFI